MIVRQNAVRDANAIKYGTWTFCSYWCWHVICQVMRFQKLKAQISAHCESSHLRAGGEEAKSLVMPWLEETVVLCTGRPLHCRSSWNVGLGSRQVNAPGTAGSCSNLVWLEKGKGRQFVLFRTTAWQ